MPTLTFYAIRHKPTGFYLPEPGGRLGRGGSHVNPTDPTIQPPRIWHNRLGARNALSMWLKGKFVASRGQDYDGEYWEDLSVIPAPERKAEDMEIALLTMEV